MSDTFSLTESGMVHQFFMAKMGHYPTSREALDRMFEEDDEFLGALEDDNPAHELKELCDKINTTIGYGLARGWNVDGAFRAVHQSNMTKQFTPEGKVQKGENYVEPDMEKYL